ncbi:MAG: hypothetical protein Fur0026_10880 [Sideroxydans sp.]
MDATASRPPDLRYSKLHFILESAKFVADTRHEMMMGEKSRHPKLTVLLAEGEDFEQAAFEWLNPG